jgi:putative lipoprotein
MVTGTLRYRKHVELPPEASILVQLVELAHDAKPEFVVAEQRFTAHGRQAPFGFDLRCPPSQIDARRRYEVRASITVDGALRFATSQHYAVITRGNASTADLLLSSV